MEIFREQYFVVHPYYILFFNVYNKIKHEITFHDNMRQIIWGKLLIMTFIK